MGGTAQMQRIDRKELAANNGNSGKPVWVAYQGKVFDLSASSLWEGGSHMGSHNAGGDLTDEISSAPHGPEMLERFPQIGTLISDELTRREAATPPNEETPVSSMPGLFIRFPVLKRHPHPMTVHFPIVLGVFAPLLIIMFFIFDAPGFELTSYYCLGASLVFIPIAMITGYISWRVNYGSHPIRAVSIKKILSIILFILDAAVFVWRSFQPGILGHFSAAGAIYFLLVFVLMPIVVIIGWYGATMTFPLTKPKR